jgi:hypothetical protein
MASKIVPAARACKGCGVRWAQGKAGLCRTCERAAGDTRTNFDRERERVEEQQEAAAQRALTEETRPARLRVIDGVEYFVTWDGT